MKKINVLSFVIISLFLSCVSTGKKLPSWVDVKPQNSDTEIYFVYGPADSLESAKAGLYKEISQYFGVQVSSVDKYIKSLSASDGEVDLSESKSINIDISSRDKGLNSIEVREIWSDSNNRWCLLASLNRLSEKEIKDQVLIDIENERVAEILQKAENITKESGATLNKLEENLNEMIKVQIRLNQTINRISGISDPNKILEESKTGLDLSDKIDQLVKDSKGLYNQIKILEKKIELFSSQIEDNEVASMSLDFFIETCSDYLLKAEDTVIELTQMEVDGGILKSEINRISLKTELELLGNQESQEQQLKINIESINQGLLDIEKLKSDLLLIYNKSEDLLRTLKQTVYSDALSENEQKKEASEILQAIDGNAEIGRSSVERSYSIKNSMKELYNGSNNSKFISNDEKKSIKSTLDKIDSPISWIEIYKDKITILYNNGKKLVDELIVEDLIDIRLKEFANSLIENSTEELELTIGEFTIEDSSISSSFSNFIKGKLSSIIASTGKIDIVDYKSVTDYLTSVNINPKTIYSGTSNATPIVTHILYGDYWSNGENIELKINLKNIKSSRLIYSKEIVIPKKSIPLGLDIKPNNYDQIVLLDKKLQGGTNSKGFEVWPNKGNGSLYTDGENMVVNIVTPVTGYVKVYHISADNELTLIFPNKFDTNNKLLAGTHYTLGDSNYPFNFKLGKPYGTESLKAIFSVEQFSDLDNSNYKESFLYSGVRGINIEKKINDDINLNSTIATSYYTITSKDPGNEK